MNEIHSASAHASITADEPLDARRLRALVLLVQEGSFASAASLLGLTPSAMSHSIKALEQDIGVPLIDRRSARAVPTAAGARLLRHAERILRNMRSARQEMAALMGDGRGILRIAAPASACQYFLPAVVLAFRQRFPDAVLRMTAADTDAALALVEEGSIDLAICMKTELPVTLEWFMLFGDELGFYVSPSHAWSGGHGVSAGALADETLIVYDRSAVTAKLIFATLKLAGEAPADVLSLGSMEAIKEMVKVGLGVGVLAPWVAAREVAEGSLVKVDLPVSAMRREWGIAHFAGQQLPGMGEVFLGLCGEATRWLGE